jgi:hypothetical protein
VLFLAVDFFAVDFFAGDFLAADFFAGDFFAVLFLAGAFFAGDFLAVDFFAADVFLAVLFFAAVDFFAVLFFAAVDFLAVLFFAAVPFLAAVFFAPVDFFAVLFFAALLFAPPVAFLAVDLAAAAAFLAGAVAFLAVGVAAATVSLGSFFAPEMTFLRSAPGVNFGTAFFFDLMVWPVCGLRTVRAFRTRFSNEPKPVIATFSPLATSRVIVSRTDSSAWAAALRFPSKRTASVSMSCDLFTSFPSNEPMEPSPCSTFLQRTLGFRGLCHNQNAAHWACFFNPLVARSTPNSSPGGCHEMPRSHPWLGIRRFGRVQSVAGFQVGRVDSYVAMSSSWDNVMSMSSRPSSSRHRV